MIKLLWMPSTTVILLKFCDLYPFQCISNSATWLRFYAKDFSTYTIMCEWSSSECSRNWTNYPNTSCTIINIICRPYITFINCIKIWDYLRGFERGQMNWWPDRRMDRQSECLNTFHLHWKDLKTASIKKYLLYTLGS